MKEFRGKTAVITGAASGIGKGLAEHCVREGMKVVLADIEEAPLQATVRSLTGQGGDVTAVRTDVASRSDVEALAEKTLAAYGSVDLLCNNAGVIMVSGNSQVWDMEWPDWEWVIGVNLWGVLHGVRTFLPIMLEQGTEGHIVNTASIAGLNTVPNASYEMTKHAVVGLTEALYLQLREAGSKIGVSALCPGMTNTNILTADRNRPRARDAVREESPPSGAQQDFLAQAAELFKTGITPTDLAAKVFQAIREDRFYILSDDKYLEDIRHRMDLILTGRNPEQMLHYP